MAATKKKAAKKKAAKAAKKATGAKKTAKKAAKKGAKKAAKKAAKKSAKKAAAKKKAAAPKKKAPAKKAASKQAAPAKKAAPKKAAAKAEAKPQAKAKAAGKKKAASGKAASKKGGKKASGQDDAPASGKKAKAKKAVQPTGPRHPKLGFKWTCFSCQSKFYDLGKDEPICPKCEADQRDRPPEEPKQTSDVPKAKIVRPMAQLLDDEEPAPAEDDLEIEGGKKKAESDEMFDDTEVVDDGGLDIDIDDDGVTSEGADPPEIDEL